MEMQIFENAQFGKVRTMVEDGTVLFCANDVANVLGYTNARDAMRRHCKGVVKHDTLTEGGIQSLSFIPEPDVYRLIFRSKLPAAQAFEQWVVEVVLPTIRKTGEYAVTKKLIELQDKADYFDAIVDTNLLTNIRTTAKELHIPERLFTFLLEDMDLAFRTPQRLLIPTAYMMNNGYAVLKEYSRNGHGGVFMLFTPLGRLYLMKRIQTRLALVEKEDLS
ncbi:BRO family protein [Bengtsoniella intestinalis]|uniref:BRO family protein n=1 Tax=Bengtsoniella intestinalis TaxID=3073143 RepID=UPI00391FAFF8